jgi:hypothetical protein
MEDHFTNKPLQSRTVGLVTSLFVACAGTSFIVLMDLLNHATSTIGLTSEHVGYLPFLCVSCIGTVVFYFLKRRIKKNIYKEMEKRLDD